MITLRELGPNDGCFCGSGKKLKKCCKKTGYWVGPNMVVTSTVRRGAGAMELLTVAAEAGTRVTPEMNLIDIYRALPPEYRAAALLDSYSITLPARVYEEKNMILGRLDYAWFLYAQKIGYVASVHDPEGLTPEKLQLAAESASRWLWNECGRDGDPPYTASVEGLAISMEADPDFGVHMKAAETVMSLFDPENRTKPMVMWILGRLVHRAFGELFREAPVGPDRKDCQCSLCRTKPHPKTCTCLYCASLDLIAKGVIVTRNDPLPGRPVGAFDTHNFTSRSVSVEEAHAMRRSAGALSRTLIIYSPDEAQARLKEAVEAAQNGQTDKARVLLKQLRFEADDAIRTLTPFADRSANGVPMSGLIAKFKSMSEAFDDLEHLLENLP